MIYMEIGRLEMWLMGMCEFTEYRRGRGGVLIKIPASIQGRFSGRFMAA